MALAPTPAGAHWATVAKTLIQSAKLNDVDPLAWLTDVLQRIVTGHTKRNELDLAGCRGIGQDAKAANPPSTA